MNIFKGFFLLLLAVCHYAVAHADSNIVYKDATVRFTLIDDGTLRLEYAPDGQFVDNKSFVAVVRDYDKVKCEVKDTKNQVVITTPKLKLTYKKNKGAFSKENLSIVSNKSLSTQFSWYPGLKQKGNLKGTYRTLDAYQGDVHKWGGDKKMPIEDGLIATDGWTLVDDSESLLFDGSKDWDWVTERKSASGAQDWYFMAYGHDYKSALKSFTRFAGRVPLPPRYVFGYWWSRYWSYSDRDFRELVENFEQLDIPLDVLVIDMDWHPISPEAGGGWTGWDWNESLFPDYKQFLSYLTEKGLKKTMNLHPAEGVRNYEKKYDEFIKHYGDAGGQHVEWLGSDKKMVNALFNTYLHPYMDEGVDFWWLDWQQWLNDKKIEKLSNTFWCNYLFFTDMERYGNKRPMLYHRWGGLGNHRYQIGFSGDAVISWESLDFLPYFNSTASNVLYGYWSHDIGGHFYLQNNIPVDPQLYTRAMQMAVYLPVMRTHSTKDAELNKEPWAFDYTTQQRLRKVINDRYALVPYIYTMAHKDYTDGISLCRPMYYDYPEKQEAYNFRNQYMFGDNIMIAPITAPVDDAGLSAVKMWLPEGQWLENETGAMVDGNKVTERIFTMDEYPSYVKAGSILPYFGKVKNLSGTEQPVIVKVYPGADKGCFAMYEDNGEDNKYADNYATTPLSYTIEAGKMTVCIGERKGQYDGMPAKRQYSVVLPCCLAPMAVTVDGSPVEFKYNGMKMEASIDLGQIDCSKGTKVEILLTPDAENYAVSGLISKMQRIQNAVKVYKKKNCGMVYTAAFGYLESAPQRMSYHPEQQKEIIQQFYEYYNNLPAVLHEQINNEELEKEFLTSIGYCQQ